MTSVNTARLIHLEDKEPGDQLSLGATLSADVQTFTGAENLVFTCINVPAGADEIVILGGRSGLSPKDSFQVVTL